MSKFDESKIKRDSDGKFGSGGGSSSKKTTKVRRTSPQGTMKKLYSPKAKGSEHIKEYGSKEDKEELSKINSEIESLDDNLPDTEFQDRLNKLDDRIGKLAKGVGKASKSKNSLTLDIYHEKKLARGKDRYGS